MSRMKRDRVSEHLVLRPEHCSYDTGRGIVWPAVAYSTDSPAHAILHVSAALLLRWDVAMFLTAAVGRSK